MVGGTDMAVMALYRDKRLYLLRWPGALSLELSLCMAPSCFSGIRATQADCNQASEAERPMQINPTHYEKRINFRYLTKQVRLIQCDGTLASGKEHSILHLSNRNFYRAHIYSYSITTDDRCKRPKHTQWQLRARPGNSSWHEMHPQL